MKAIKLTSFAGALLILAGCGGGGGGSVTGGATLSSATFVDSPVEGLHFTASPSGTTGTTDETGKFTFVEGDTVSFKIGGASGLEIASSKPKPSTPIFVADLPAGTQIAQILQSFDTGGNSSSKLDLSKITSIPDATKTALKSHIDARGDFTAGATAITNAINEVWAANTATLATVTKPSAKTQNDVETHLATSVAKLPKNIKSLTGATYLNLVAGDTTSFSISAFSENGKYQGLEGDLVELKGTYTVDSDTVVTVNPSQGKKITDTGDYIPIDCKTVATVKEYIVGGVVTANEVSGKDCTSRSFTETHYTLDKGFNKDWLKGKTIDASALSDYPDACLPSKWVISSDGSSVNATNSTNSNCTTASFTGKLEAPFADDGYTYILTVAGTSGNYKLLYVITKLAGFTDRFGSIIYVSTDGGSTYKYNVGRLVQATAK